MFCLPVNRGEPCADVDVFGKDAEEKEVFSQDHGDDLATTVEVNCEGRRKDGVGGVEDSLGEWE